MNDNAIDTYFNDILLLFVFLMFHVQINADLEKFEQMWGMFEEFQTGLEEMRKEEWIIFRSKLYKFEEYLKSWTEKLNSQEKAVPI